MNPRRYAVSVPNIDHTTSRGNTKVGVSNGIVKCKIKRTLSEKEEKAGMKARKPRDPESPKGFPGGLTRRP